MRNSKWFVEGEKAYMSGLNVSECPYGARSAKALIWLEGFKRQEQTNPHTVGEESSIGTPV